jgi:hypothetical protein
MPRPECANRFPLRTTCLRTNSLRGAVVAAAWLAATATAGNTSAAEREPAAAGARAVTLNEEGARYYAARDYRRAVEKFIQAYAVDSDPNLLFNIASCYEGLGDLEAAVEKYREFLSAPGADPSGRPHAEAVIERWEQPVTGKAGAAPIVETAPAAPPPEPPVQAASSAASADAQSWVPWMTLGGGSIIAAVGGTFYFLGARDHSRVTEAKGYDDPMAVSSMTRAEADELIDTGRQKKQMGVAGLAVGGALVAGYVVWWLLDDPEPSETLPVITPSAAGATLTVAGSF